MADPVKKLLWFRKQMQDYRKKSSRYSNLLKKYNKNFDERLEKIRAFKNGLTVSNTDDIEHYYQMCYDACQDLQDFFKRLKAELQDK